MRSLPAGFKRVFLILALVFAAPTPAQVLEARIARVQTGAGSLEQVQLRVDWPQGAERGTLRLRAAKVALPAIAWQAQDVDWNCPLVRAPQGKWRCEGPVRVRIVSRAGEAAIQHGPFKLLRTVGGVLHADDCCLHVCMPGRASKFAANCHEISFLP